MVLYKSVYYYDFLNILLLLLFLPLENTKAV